MKLIKIGSSSSADYVINSQFVSAHHAEILLADDGKIYIEDCGSSNGTFIGNNTTPIQPNKSIVIQRGDYVRLADTVLDWRRISAPKPQPGSRYLNIGTDFRNDIVVNGSFISRFHAVLRIDKSGKCFLLDEGSKNGTKLNGIAIRKNQEMRINRGDNVVCGDTDITEDLQPYMPKSNLNWLMYIGAAAAACVLVVLVAILWPKQKTDCLVCHNVNCEYKGKHPAKDFENTVVYVMAQYHYILKFNNCPIDDDVWREVFNEKGGTMDLTKTATRYEATAFFVDRDGRLATNRHVVKPWDYDSEDEKRTLRTQAENIINSSLPLNIMSMADLQAVYNNSGNYLCKAIQTQLSKMVQQGQLNTRNYLNTAISLITQMRRCTFEVDGKLDFISIGYANNNITHIDELQRCDVLCDSETKDKDIALIQLNDKRTPSFVKYVFSPQNFATNELVPQADKLYMIGYPAGLALNLDQGSHSLNPYIRETRCNRTINKYEISLDVASMGGASGSPVFNEYGQVVGVHCSILRNTSFSQACQARFLQQLYINETGLSMDTNEAEHE